MLKYILAAAALFGTAVWAFTPEQSIYSYLEDAVNDSLADASERLDDIDADYIPVGRDVILHVYNGDEDSVSDAVNLLERQRGVGSVFPVGSVSASNFSSAAAALSNSGRDILFVEMSHENNVVTLSGNAVSEERTQQLLRQFESSGRRFNSYLEYSADVSIGDWVRFLETYLQEMSLSDSGRVLLTSSGVSISAEDPAYASRLQGALSDIGFDIPVRTEVPQHLQVETVKPTVDDCNSRIGVLLEDTRIAFRHDSTVLNQSSVTVLQEISGLEGCDEYLLLVEGHTDSLGPAIFNQQLSLERAEIVRAELVRRGMAEQQIRAVGAGETQPIASNDTRVGRASNRRIELEFVSNGSS